MIVIFSGPTISHAEIEALVECRCLPPVQHGDILGLNLSEVSAIGIIDGYFEGAPSVWHKEILYAMDQSVPVYGASSMGALRAAELHAFGMRGVGRIFEWYRDLVIEDDDEVAVLHGPAEVGYAVASEPMVSIRATLELALNEGVVAQEQHDLLIKEAKQTFYKKRHWRDLLGFVEVEGLVEWVSEKKIDLKRLDGVAMLERMKLDSGSFDQPFETDYQFEWTNVWDHAYNTLAYENQNNTNLNEEDQMVFDQLRLSPLQYRQYEEKALRSWISSHAVETPDAGDLQRALKRFRERNGLSTRAMLTAYMEQIGLDEAGLIRLLEGEAELDVVRRSVVGLAGLVIAQLKLDGTYLGLLGEANAKAESLRAGDIAVDSASLNRGRALDWYFEKYLEARMPNDLEDYVFCHGFWDVDEFYRVVGGEYIYQRVVA